ncbi:unnamed protein product [Lactuca saligna]|uniref:Uncharacterized protein n=1 Tax=Lactuca saligna TaxID=75948 RepID=A0AA35YBQ4_LACSI|nr:unnamed protein product [Lactuca saligna]
MTLATLNENIISEKPLKSPHNDAIHPDPDEEHPSKFMFNEDSASIDAPLVGSYILYSQKPSSSKLAYGIGLSISSSEPDNDEINIDDQAHNNREGNTKTNHPKYDQATTTNKFGPSEPPMNPEHDKSKTMSSSLDT